MKELVFLRSTKGKAIIVAAAAVLAAAVTVTVLLLSGGGTGYRNISVSKISGNVTAENGGNEYKAYENMRLADGYALTTGTDSYARLVLDDDKYVKLGQESRAVFTNVGSANSHVTAITVEFGTITSEVVNPLTEEESFVVTTPNAVLAVRGTMFKVGVDRDGSGKTLTDVYTFGGTVSCRLVLPDGTVSDEEIMITQGCRSCIESDADGVRFLGDAVVPISTDDLSDEDIVDIYNASAHGHAMFVETAELWQEIADRNIDLSKYDSAYGYGEAIPYIETAESTSDSDTAETTAVAEETEDTTTASQSESTSETSVSRVEEPTETSAPITVPAVAPKPEETPSASVTATPAPQVTTRPETKPAVTTAQTTTPQATTAEEPEPEVTEPEETEPEATEPEETEPEETEPEETEPEETEPEETRPASTGPQWSWPDWNWPDWTRPEESRPEETKPQETKPQEPEAPPVQGPLYVEDGSITINETGYKQGDDGEYVAYKGNYVIKQKDTGAANDFCIKVESGTHSITIEGLNIQGNSSALHVAEGAGVTLNCTSQNIIASGSSAIQNEGTIKIQSGSVSISGSAGIRNSGSFAVSGGTVTASALNSYSGVFTVSGGSVTVGSAKEHEKENLTMDITGGSFCVTGAIDSSIVNSSGSELKCIVYEYYPGNILVTVSDENKYTYSLSAGDAVDGKYYVWVPADCTVTPGPDAGSPDGADGENAVTESPDNDVDGYLPKKEPEAARLDEEGTEKELPL